jgi:hypothetical protein
MKIVVPCILIILTILSCNIPKELNNSSYIYKSKKRTLRLVFSNDSICRMENVFHCNDIDLDIKELTTTCVYKRIEDKIILRNVNFQRDTNLYLYIPPQESINCSLLNANKREHSKIGPNYLTQYEKYGLVPNIDTDTLLLFKNKILLTKPGELINKGYIFRKQLFLCNFKKE